MKRVILLIILFTLHFELFAQTYQSIFGSNNTSWTIKHENLSGVGTDSLYFQRDTLINGITYKKVNSSMGETYFFNENLSSGQVSYFSNTDTSIKLLMDLSLDVGDTFIVDGAWLANPAYYEVDSVYTESGRKHVQVNLELFYAENEKLTFIEGVGTNAGMYYQDNYSGKLNPYLLCLWKDGTQEFSNLYYSGMCNLTSTGIEFEKIQEAGFKIIHYPNPAGDYLNLEVLGSTEIKTVDIKVFDVHGRLIIESRNLEAEDSIYRINTSDLPTGLYFYNFIKDGSGIYNGSFKVKK